MAVNFFGKSAPLSFLLGDCTPFLGLARSGGDKPAIALLRPDNPRRYEGEPPRLWRDIQSGVSCRAGMARVVHSRRPNPPPSGSMRSRNGIGLLSQQGQCSEKQLLTTLPYVSVRARPHSSGRVDVQLLR